MCFHTAIGYLDGLNCGSIQYFSLNGCPTSSSGVMFSIAMDTTYGSCKTSSRSLPLCWCTHTYSWLYCNYNDMLHFISNPQIASSEPDLDSAEVMSILTIFPTWHLYVSLVLILATYRVPISAIFAVIELYVSFIH